MIMIAGGVALFFLEGAFSGIWFALIGWFLFGAATAEARLGELRRPQQDLDKPRPRFRDAA